MKLVLFDLDNTLLAGDSDFEWAQFLISKGVLDREVHEARNIEFYEHYKAGTLDIQAFLDFQLAPTRELVLVAPAGEMNAATGTEMERTAASTDAVPAIPELAELATVARSAFRPHLVLAGGREGDEEPELLRNRPTLDGRPTAYLCENFSCRLPVTTAADLRVELDDT